VSSRRQGLLRHIGMPASAGIAEVDNTLYVRRTQARATAPRAGAAAARPPRAKA
jgi:glutamate synthase domain-containing protein 2